MGNLLIYSAAGNFCIWPLALPRCRRCRALLGRKSIRRGQCASSLALPRAARATLLRACLGNYCRSGSASHSSWRTDREPAKTVPEFIAYAKTNPGKINMGSSGVGTVLHLSGELFKMMAGLDMVHVPNRSGGQLNDLIAGQVQVVFSPLPITVEQVRAGRLRALAVTSASRLEAMPDVPTLNEFLPGYETSGWNGVGAPKNTPAEIIEKLNKEINAGLASPGIKARFADLGLTALTGTPADFGKFIAAETEKWGKVIQAAHIKAE